MCIWHYLIKEFGLWQSLSQQTKKALAKMFVHVTITVKIQQIQMTGVRSNVPSVGNLIHIRNCLKQIIIKQDYQSDQMFNVTFWYRFQYSVLPKNLDQCQKSAEVHYPALGKHLYVCVLCVLDVTRSTHHVRTTMVSGPLHQSSTSHPCSRRRCVSDTCGPS